MISRSRPSQAQLIATAKFPPRYFLESLAVRKDNSLLISAMNHRELWYVPPWNGMDLSDPLLLYTFPQLTMGITEGRTTSFICFYRISTHPMSHICYESIWLIGNLASQSHLSRS